MIRKNAYGFEDLNQYDIVAWKDFEGKVIHKRVPWYDVDRMIEALKGQGAQCGYWSMESWQQVKEQVLSGKYFR